jgi:hypothetical protein
VASAAALGVVLALLGAPAEARPTTAGTFRCRLAATRLGPRIEVTFRLRGLDAGRAWRVRMWNGGVKFADRTRVTDGLGRLRVVGITRNRPGADEIVAIGRDQVTLAPCKVELSI